MNQHDSPEEKVKILNHNTETQNKKLLQLSFLQNRENPETRGK